ncbi:hypothetical protein J2R62_18575 [Plesiomonas shigelloides]|uniref:Uncharacterized protein n=1 Tax=Plesiomonas shigelloides TaxID=703 RepID=A0A8I1WCC6_PLESH|nr:hypothetical protein [Plesiomonas shigelloides]MBO1110120.1 hypothetical protein [Plesiomonas shigelloides]
MVGALCGDEVSGLAGITPLRDVLNDCLRTPGAIGLGGVKPACSAQMQDSLTGRCRHRVDGGQRTGALCNYDGLQGKDSFLHALGA